MRTWRAIWRGFFARFSPSRHGSTADNANARAGADGERAAEVHLRAAGLRVVARNWRNPDDQREELDLVCIDPAPRGSGGGDVLVFVEVKARVAGSRVGGYQAVDKRKKAVLLRVCRAYLARLRPPARHFRFDIVEVAHGADPAADAAMAAMRLDPRVAAIRDGRQVWHHRDVSLFPERANHRHG
ncbi:MAG: YraN family protein [Burkholderiales bacterium]|nr:YraN family protein [Opitutaceae bacterium]